MLPELKFKKHIPDKLLGKRFKFIKLGFNNSEWAKRPVEKDWRKTNNYGCYSIDLNEHIANGGNYGILTGVGNLLVIDFDSREFQDKLFKVLPPTFTVKTAGKELYHLYYQIDKPFTKRPIRDSDGKTVADLQCVGAYVVAPNSANGSRKYKVVFDIPIAKVSYDILKKLFPKVFIEKSRPNVRHYNDDYLTVTDVLNKLNAAHVRSLFWVDPKFGITKGNRHNFKVREDNKAWFSYHSWEGGGVLRLIMYYYDISADKAKEVLKQWRRK